MVFSARRTRKTVLLNGIQDGTNETPLHEAAANGNLNTVKLLCGYKETDVDKSDGVSARRTWVNRNMVFY